MSQIPVISCAPIIRISTGAAFLAPFGSAAPIGSHRRNSLRNWVAASAAAEMTMRFVTMDEQKRAAAVKYSMLGGVSIIGVFAAMWLVGIFMNYAFNNVL